MGKKLCPTPPCGPQAAQPRPLCSCRFGVSLEPGRLPLVVRRGRSKTADATDPDSVPSLISDIEACARSANRPDRGALSGSCRASSHSKSSWLPFYEKGWPRRPPTFAEPCGKSHPRRRGWRVALSIRFRIGPDTEIADVQHEVERARARVNASNSNTS